MKEEEGKAVRVAVFILVCDTYYPGIMSLITSQGTDWIRTESQSRVMGEIYEDLRTKLGDCAILSFVAALCWHPHGRVGTNTPLRDRSKEGSSPLLFAYTPHS